MEKGTRLRKKLKKLLNCFPWKGWRKKRIKRRTIQGKKRKKKRKNRRRMILSFCKY